ncbi:MAG: peptidoglycan-binding protein [Rhodospirillales bacterium]|nr:peptidoglycan-binding protein [Alphaproteobacteria bacterium]USO04031.1 MAG: peptidoglycan-binding protein [Rhodospirillales bacterium]
MKIKLSKPFAANSAVDEFDVRQIKKALNRLGYYQPYEKTGITGIPDAGVFSALQSFQKDQGLQATGTARPGDETVSKLGHEAGKKKSGKYIWRSVGDNKVRDSHAELNGTVRDLADSPDPGEEFNCRCWAEPVNCGKEFITQNVISGINDAENQWAWWDYLVHFYIAGGQSITLPDIGWLAPIIEESKTQVFIPVQEQVVDLARQIEQGKLRYTTENTYEFGGISYPIGDATVSSETIGTVSINGKCLIIDAEVTYTFFDDFTDPASIRELNKKFQKKGYPYLYETLPLVIPENMPEWLRLHFEKGDWTELRGTPYFIHGKWKTKLSSTIKRVGQDLK